MSKQILRKRQQWRVYKPKKENNGAASRVEVKVVTEEREKDGKRFTDRDVQLFWVASPQVGVDSAGNASFSWKEENDTKSVTLKLGENDIGEILAVLNRKKKQAGSEKGIFHKNQNGNTIFTFEYSEYNGNVSYKIRLAKQVKGVVTAVTHSITIGEGEILKVLLESAVRLMYQW